MKLPKPVWPLLAGVFGAALVFLNSIAGQVSPAKIPLRFILVKSADEADKIHAQLQSGFDFGVLARPKSVDATSADGGLMGDVDPAQLRAEMRDALHGVEPGSISPVFKLPGGFGIVKVMRANEVAELEEVERIRQDVARAETNIKFDTDISGINETEAALVSLPKPQDWYVDVNAACGYKKQSLEALRQRIVTLEDPNAGGPGAHRTPYDLLAVRIADGQYHIFFGEPDKAVEQWEIAYGMAQKENQRYVPYVEKLLGMGYLQKAQTVNELYRHPGDRCIFPIDPKYKLTKVEDSARAIQYLTKSFQSKPDDLEVQWLLNLAHMMAGTYPAGVPKDALIPPTAFASTEDIGRFKDVAPQAGITMPRCRVDILSLTVRMRKTPAGRSRPTGGTPKDATHQDDSRPPRDVPGNPHPRRSINPSEPGKLRANTYVDDGFATCTDSAGGDSGSGVETQPPPAAAALMFDRGSGCRSGFAARFLPPAGATAS